ERSYAKETQGPHRRRRHRRSGGRDGVAAGRHRGRSLRSARGRRGRGRRLPHPRQQRPGRPARHRRPPTRALGGLPHAAHGDPERHGQTPRRGPQRRDASRWHGKPDPQAGQPLPSAARRGHPTRGQHRVREAARGRGGHAGRWRHGELRGRHRGRGGPSDRGRRHTLQDPPRHRPVGARGPLRPRAQRRRVRPGCACGGRAGHVPHGLRRARVLRLRGPSLGRGLVVRQPSLARRAEQGGARRHQHGMLEGDADGALRRGRHSGGRHRPRDPGQARRLGHLRPPIRPHVAQGGDDRHRGRGARDRALIRAGRLHGHRRRRRARQVPAGSPGDRAGLRRLRAVAPPAGGARRRARGQDQQQQGGRTRRTGAARPDAARDPQARRQRRIPRVDARLSHRLGREGGRL
ncbi:MAG: Uncharacterized oxidoreductase, partial [uncultured Rubrobacteraceae bacterium]